MANLNKLAINYAKCADEIRQLKADKALALSKCDGGEFTKSESESCVDFSFLDVDDLTYGTCSYNSYTTTNRFNKEGDDHCTYDEILSTYGCEHCNKAYAIKKEISAISRKLGGIRSAITIAGRKLAKEGES